MAFSKFAWALVLLTLTPTSFSEPVSENEKESFPWVLRGAYQPSSVHQTSLFLVEGPVVGGAIDQAQAFKLELGWQVDGGEPWHQSYRLPAMGVGIYHATFRNGERLGSPTAIYGWFSWPWLSLGERVELTTDFGFGAAFGWNARSAESNPLNDVISTPVSFYTEVGVYLRYKLGAPVSLYAGGTFTHFSNGGTGDPNGAINAVSPRVGIRYDFGTTRRVVQADRPSVRRHWALSVGGGGGFKNVNLGDASSASTDFRRNFGMGVVSLDLQRRVRPTSQIGGGFDLVFDGSAGTRAEATSEPGDVTVAVYVGYEQVIHRFRIPIQLGYYLRQGERAGNRPAAYQKLGWSFDLSRRTYVRFDVRFYDLSQADFVTWTLGYRF